ncbi:microtubule organization protein AKNA-like isoform X1 [Lytechinus variegatus]|uniref:microtubule organization protein AKNA-like isoform X1 n=1 Tax=Lytechinus variegatus TaxID=7654 RepID=UPI001BB23F52|nr:microtubule organization protein AKNA-like isoform X1 [Lytechinus variegatus]
MAGSGGSFDDLDIDFDLDDADQGSRYTSASFSSSPGIEDEYGGEVFSPEPEGENNYSMSHCKDGIQRRKESQEIEEYGDIGPLTPRGKIIGNGFDRPIHRQSLQEFEHLEQILKDQSQDTAEDVHMDDQLLNGKLSGGYEADRRSSGDMDYESDHDYDINGSDRPEGEENVQIGSDDMMKYMQATPRSTQEFPPGEDHRLSRLMENSYDNDSLDDGEGQVNQQFVPSPQQDFFSLSQEQLPEGPSHLDSEDGSDLFANSGNNTLQDKESLSTVIQAAAANVETFGTGDSPESKKDSSGGDVEHFKPISTSYRRPSKPQTAAQLKNKTISDQSSAGDQNSQQSIEGRRRTSSVKSFRTRSSRASTPQSVLSRSRRSSMRSIDDQSEYSIQESIGQVSPRSSTPGHNSTLIHQGDEFSPSPVKHNKESPQAVIPRLRLDNMSARSDQSSIVSDIHHLDKSARSRLVSDEFVDQLQKEYDDLLQKYAQAENTIDSLRLGARVNLHYEGSPVGQPGNVGISPAKHSQDITLPKGQKGMLSSSQNSLVHPPGVNSVIHVHSSNINMGASTSRKGETQKALPDTSEGKLLALQFQTEGHKEKVDSFEILLQENHLDPADQQRGLEGLKSGQAKLEADYMQAKEEHSMKVRLGSARGQEATFDPEKLVEGQLFQLGMRLEDIQEKVQENLRNNPPELPATPQRKPSDADLAMRDPHGLVPSRRTSSHSPEEDYALLIHKYNELKQLPPHPERDKEIQKLVKSLQDMPQFALNQPDHEDVAGYHGNDVEMQEEEDEIDFIADVEDHDGDDDGSSNHSSPFRETMSPDVFRPKGSRHDKLPKWQPPVDGSNSSLGSPDHDPPSSVHSRKKSIPGKSGSKHTPPRPNSTHQSSNPRGNGGGDTRKPRGNKTTLGAHLEPEGDSGFLGSESSRQSLQVRGSDTSTRNRAQRLPPHSENPKSHLTRHSMIPVKGSQMGRLKTPLRNNGSVPLRQEPLAEEEDSMYSGGVKRARELKQDVRPHGMQDSQKAAGNRTKERRPQTVTPREKQRRDPRSEVHQPHRMSMKQTNRQGYAPPPPAQQRTYPQTEQGTPLGTQYLSQSRGNNQRTNTTPAPQRVSRQRMESTRRPVESPPKQHQEFDRRSDVTRSSVRSEALQALQDEVNQLKAKMANARQDPIPEETGYSRIRNLGDEDDEMLSSRSSKSEMLHMLQEEIEDLKDQLADRDATPSRMPYASSTPLRDTIRDVLSERYIPGRNPSFNASPIPKKYHSGTKHYNGSTIRTPSRPVNPSFSSQTGVKYSPTSPPRVSRTPGVFQAPSGQYQTETLPCPMCGGTGSHTHSEYTHPPPSNPAPPAQTYVPSYSSPAQSMRYLPQTSYTQPSPTVAPQTMSAVPQQNPSIPIYQGQSYVLPQPATLTPQATQQVPGNVSQVMGAVPTAVPVTPTLNQTSAHGTPSHLRPDARPVYLIPSKNRGRYYIREDEEEGSSAEGEEEFYYRRTPKSSRSSRRHTSRTVKQKKVSEVPFELELSLDDALHMAQRLKRTTRQMVSSVRRDVRLAESFN